MSTTTRVKSNSLGVHEQPKEEQILTLPTAAIIIGLGVVVGVVAAGTVAAAKGTVAAKGLLVATAGFFWP